MAPKRSYVKVIPYSLQTGQLLDTIDIFYLIFDNCLIFNPGINKNSLNFLL